MALSVAQPTTFSHRLARLPLWPIAIWGMLMASALIARPPLAPDEARILSIAWRMWADGALLLLPLPLLAPLWMAPGTPRQWLSWYGRLLLALLGGAVLALFWAIPVFLLVPGEAGRTPVVHGAFTLSDPDRPWYWGSAMAPLMLYPWLWWPTLWRAACRQWRLFGEPAVRFCLVAAATGLA